MFEGLKEGLKSIFGLIHLVESKCDGKAGPNPDWMNFPIIRVNGRQFCICLKDIIIFF